MSPFNPTQLLEMLEKAREQNFCLNRIWHVCSQIKDWPSKQLIIEEILRAIVSKSALKHEDHSACSVDFCEFSIRNFTAVQQYHEPMSYEEGDQGKIAEDHKQQGACITVRGVFKETKLIQAVRSDKLTAWNLDGWDILESPRPFMAISHVWSDGTGTGSWPSNQVNVCLYNYFKRIAKQFQCEGIWWDAICIPQDKTVRSKAISIMDRNYEHARVTLVHDRFLRNLSFEGPERACLAIVLSSWFTRGWTALELTRSRKVKIIFKDSIKDLDEEILYGNESFGAKIIKDLRNDRFTKIGALLAALNTRYTSWLKDRATIAGLLAGIQIPDTEKDTFQQDIYQRILKGIGEISYDHLFHNCVTMPRAFSWCATSLFQLPQATTKNSLRINRLGEVFGPWRVYPVDQIYPKCLWEKSHKLIEAKLKYALRNEAKKHLLLVEPLQNEVNTTVVKKGLLVKVLKNLYREKPRFKCQFVGSLYLHATLGNSKSETRQITIGDTEGWEELNDDEDAWRITMQSDLSPEITTEALEGSLTLPTFESDANTDLPDLHCATWLCNIRICTTIIHEMEDDLKGLLQKRDILGRRAIHLAAERGLKQLVRVLIDNHDDPNSRISPETSYANNNYSVKHHDSGQTPLHRAAWGGSLETVKFLLAKGANADMTDRVGNTSLHVAADLGFRKVAECLCNRANLGAQGHNGLTPLHYAALGGHYDVVELLITRSAPIGVKDNFGWTPLHCAAEHGCTSVIELLLSKGANINEPDNKVGWTPLHFAAMNGHKEAVGALVHKADINKHDTIGFTPLTFAAVNGHTAIVELLVKHGATVSNDVFPWKLEDIECYDTVIESLRKHMQKFDTALNSTRWNQIYLAAIDGGAKTIRLVADNDGDIGEKSTNDDASLLDLAAVSGHLRTVRLLLQLGYNSNSRWGPIWHAATRGHDDVVQALFQASPGHDTEGLDRLLYQAVDTGRVIATRSLIKAGANTEVSYKQRETPLYRAIRRDDEAVVRALLEAGADTEALNINRETPLIIATLYERKNPVIIRMLLDAGANTEALDPLGRTLLQCAFIFRYDDSFIQMLLEAGANTEVVDPLGRTPLLYAVIHRYNDNVIRMLLKAGANVDVSDTQRNTPLRVAVQCFDKRAVQMLLDKGASMETLDWQGRTPLLQAIKSRNRSVIQMLIKSGANIEALDKHGCTPLSAAIEDGSEDTVKALLKMGANIKAPDKWDRTPLSKAQERGGAMLALLRAHADNQTP